MLDIQVRAYNEQYNLNYFNVIPTNIYGKNDNFNLENGHVIPALIHKTFLAMQNKEDLVIMGSGKAVREFIFSEDVAKLCKRLIESYDGKGPVILSDSKSQISIADLVSLIVELSGFKGKVIFDSSKSDGQLIKSTDNSKLLDITNNNFSFTSLEEGLKITIDWFFKNYDRARI